jgi:plasmid stability protein
MTSITVRHVPETTRDELAARAARAGQSLQEYLLAALIHMAARPDLAVVLAQVRERKATLVTELGAAEIVAHRDADRR